MRSETEIRAAIETLEWLVANTAFEALNAAALAGEIAGLRYALREKDAGYSIEDTITAAEDVRAFAAGFAMGAV